MADFALANSIPSANRIQVRGPEAAVFAASDALQSLERLLMACIDALQAPSCRVRSTEVPEGTSDAVLLVQHCLDWISLAMDIMGECPLRCFNRLATATRVLYAVALHSSTSDAWTSPSSAKKSLRWYLTVLHLTAADASCRPT